MNFAAHVTTFKGLLTRFKTRALITSSENSFYEYFIDGTSPNRVSRKFVLYKPLRGTAVLTILTSVLFVLEPVLVLLAVRHGGVFEGPGLL